MLGLPLTDCFVLFLAGMEREGKEEIAHTIPTSSGASKPCLRIQSRASWRQSRISPAPVSNLATLNEPCLQRGESAAAGLKAGSIMAVPFAEAKAMLVSM